MLCVAVDIKQGRSGDGSFELRPLMNAIACDTLAARIDGAPKCIALSCSRLPKNSLPRQMLSSLLLAFVMVATLTTGAADNTFHLQPDNEIGVYQLLQNPELVLSTMSIISGLTGYQSSPLFVAPWAD